MEREILAGLISKKDQILKQLNTVLNDIEECKSDIKKKPRLKVVSASTK